MRFVFLLGLLIPDIAAAAVIEQAMMGGQPQMIMHEGKPTMCGLRVVVQPTTFRDPKSSEVSMLDTSIVMGREGIVMIKGFGIVATPEDLLAGKISKFSLQSLWFKPEGSRATRPNEGKTTVGEDGVSLMYSDQEQFAVYTNFLQSVLDGKPVMIGFRRSAKEDERIVSGVIQLSKPDFALFMQCNAELVEEQ